MLRLPTEPLAIAFSPGRVGIARKATVWRRQPRSVISVAASAEDWPATLAALADWIEQEGMSGGSATVTVSNHWARFALMPWSDAVANEVEELALASACLETAYGDMTGWSIATEPGRYGYARIVCALETAFLDRLRALMRKHRIACRGIFPYFVVASKPARPLFSATAGVLAVAESETVVLASTRKGRWHSLRSVRCELSSATLGKMLAREALLQDIGDAAALGVMAPGMDLTGLPMLKLPRIEAASSSPAEIMALETAASRGRMAVDFAVKSWSAGKLGGMLGLLVAFGVAVWSGWEYDSQMRQQAAWQADWQRLNSRPTRQAVASSPEDRERLKTELRLAQQVIEKLNTPWDSLFGAIEGVFNEQVTLLSVEPDAERQEVRLMAEAKDLAAMLDYVQQVRQSPALKEAYLADHQIDRQDPLHPVRFTVFARWVAYVATENAPTPRAATSEVNLP